MSRGGKNKNAPHKIDKRGETYFMVPHAVYDSVAYATISVRAKTLLYGFLRRLNGYNNGKLTYSAREMASDLNGTHHAYVQEAVEELIAGGFVVMTKSHPKISRMANEWRLTFAAYGLHENPIPATNEYKDASPKSIKAVRRHHEEKRKRFRKGKHSGVETGSTENPDAVETGSTVGKHSVETGSTVSDGNKPKTPSASVETGSTHISYHDRGKSPLPSSILRGDDHLPDSTLYMTATDLRSFTKAYLQWAGTGAQTQLSKLAKIPGGTMSKFLKGRGMNPDNLAALHMAVHRNWPVKDRKGYWPPVSLKLAAQDGEQIAQH